MTVTVTVNALGRARATQDRENILNVLSDDALPCATIAHAVRLPIARTAKFLRQLAADRRACFHPGDPPSSSGTWTRSP